MSAVAACRNQFKMVVDKTEGTPARKMRVVACLEIGTLKNFIADMAKLVAQRALAWDPQLCGRHPLLFHAI